MSKIRNELKSFLFDEIRKEHPEYNDATDHSLDLKFFQAPTTIRLRPLGFTILKTIFECYEFPLEERLNGKELIALKNKVGLPYFLPASGRKIYIFSTKSAFLLNLKGGDVKSWLNSLISRN